MSREFKFLMLVLLPLVIGVVLGRQAPAVNMSTPAGRQRINMAVAREELPRVQSIVDADKRFSEVKTFVCTGQDGAVGLVGRVEKDEDLFRLMIAVAAERLRVAVSWQVKVMARAP